MYFLKINEDAYSVMKMIIDFQEFKKQILIYKASGSAIEQVSEAV